MTKQTEFSHPPAGHVGVLGYDSADDHWYALSVNDSGNVPVELTGGTVEVTQDVPSALRALVDSVPRMPGGVTDLTATYFASIANQSFVEVLSKTNATTIAGCGGRVVENGKRMCVIYMAGNILTTNGQVGIIIDKGGTNQFVAYNACPLVEFGPPAAYYCVGDGITTWRILAQNNSGGAANTRITVMAWEEIVY